MSAQPGLRLAVFDVDGTLASSFVHIETAMRRAFEDAEAVFPGTPTMRSVIGLTLADALSVLARDVSAGKARLIGEGYKHHYQVLRQERPEPLFPGVEEMLTSFVEDGWLMGVATGKSRRGLDALFANHDLARFFDIIRTADDGPGKPHPFMVADAAASFGVEPAATVMIGDAVHDMAMARAAQAKALGVSWGAGDAAALRAAGAHEVVEAMADLRAAAGSILCEPVSALASGSKGAAR
jgi:phosphoglycolate phosphatase